MRWRRRATASPASATRSFGFDAAGNTTSDSSGGGSGYTATYNLRGQLETITRAGVTTTYTYNAAGQRVRKASSTGAVVHFVHDNAGHLLGEYDGQGVALREYVWLRDTPVAMFTPDPANPTGAALVYYIHTDHLDAPRIVVDRNNQTRWRWISEPFGTTAPETNPQGLGDFTQNLRFPGQYADAESGLWYNHHRYYGAAEGRYTQSDPIGLHGGTNTYGYVGGNPTSYVDALGLFESSPWLRQPCPARSPSTMLSLLGSKEAMGGLPRTEQRCSWSRPCLRCLWGRRAQLRQWRNVRLLPQGVELPQRVEPRSSKGKAMSSLRRFPLSKVKRA